MAWKKEDIEKEFEEICEEISKGSSLRAALDINGRPSSFTFYQWLESDPNKAKQYARATQDREDKIFDEILEISDKQGEDVIHTDDGDIINHNVINRNRLQVDTRKWMLGKLNPKKYGDRVQQDITADVKVEDAIDYSKLPKEALLAIANARK